MLHIAIGVMSGPRDGDVLHMDAAPDMVLIIGRREDSDICLSYDNQVSREHASIVYDGQSFWLEDLRSTNGTFLGDTRITGRVEIRPGQLFRVGRTWLRLEPNAMFAADTDASY